MFDNLRKMEPLPAEEERRIAHRLRLGVIVVAVVVLAFVIWSIVTKRGLSKIYYVLVVALLATNWLLSDVVPIFLCRTLAGRSKKQAEAYVRASLFGLLANAGLGWFLLAMSNQSIYGALMYLVGMTMGRKQREIYSNPEEEEEENPEEAEAAPEESPDYLPTAADRLRRLNELAEQADAENSSEGKAEAQSAADEAAEDAGSVAAVVPEEPPEASSSDGQGTEVE